MKKLNELLDKLEKLTPHVSGKIEDYGKGYMLQVVSAYKKGNDLNIKEDAKPGIYVNDSQDFKIIEILYENKKQKKEYDKQMFELLIEELENKIVYVSCLSESKDSLMMQLFILEEVTPFKYTR